MKETLMIPASKFLVRKFGGTVIVAIAFAACSVPVVILAMQTADYVFGQ